MKTPCNPVMRSTHFAPPLLCLCSIILLLAGCVSNKYKAAKKDTPPPQLLNVAFGLAPLEATLNTVITYNGPGSWKRDALWDEYVVTLHNSGNQPITVVTVELTDPDGTVRLAGADPWALEKESKTLEQRYRDTGVAFVRYTVSGALLVGAGFTAAAAGTLGVSAAAAGAATVTVVALPLYFLVASTINYDNKVAMEKEFSHRRLAPPLTLAPGETRTGSLFFPMVPSPRSFSLGWSNGSDSGKAFLPLEFLHGLHIKAPAPATGK